MSWASSMWFLVTLKIDLAKAEPVSRGYFPMQWMWKVVWSSSQLGETQAISPEQGQVLLLNRLNVTKCDESFSMEDCYKAVMSSLKVGYMGLDTDPVYDKEVGREVVEIGIARENPFIGTKRWRRFVSSAEWKNKMWFRVEKISENSWSEDGWSVADWQAWEAS